MALLSESALTTVWLWWRQWWLQGKPGQAESLSEALAPYMLYPNNRKGLFWLIPHNVILCFIQTQFLWLIVMSFCGMSACGADKGKWTFLPFNILYFPQVGPHTWRITVVCVCVFRILEYRSSWPCFLHPDLSHAADKMILLRGKRSSLLCFPPHTSPHHPTSLYALLQLLLPPSSSWMCQESFSLGTVLAVPAVHFCSISPPHWSLLCSLQTKPGQPLLPSPLTLKALTSFLLVLADWL